MKGLKRKEILDNHLSSLNELNPEKQQDEEFILQSIQRQTLKDFCKYLSKTGTTVNESDIDDYYAESE